MGQKVEEELMSEEAVTWDNIEGLSPEERQLGKAALGNVDLRGVTFQGNVVNGVRLPDIINGVVKR